MAVQILIGGVDVSAAYKGGSLRVTSRTGSDRSGFSFILDKSSVAPTEEQEVIIWDSSLQRRRVARGRVKRARRRQTGPSPDPTGILENIMNFAYDVEVGGFMRDIERRPITSDVYIDKTTGFIFRDQGLQVPGFDVSLVGIGGALQTIFECRHESIMRVFDRLAQIEGKAWWVDLDKRLHFEAPGEIYAPFEITETTWRDLAGLSLTAEPDSSNLANSITMFFKGKYQEGQVNVFNNSNEVTAADPSAVQWLDHVAPGSKFRLKDETLISYTVQKVEANKLTLSSAYGEPTSIAPVDYVIEDVPRATQAEDPVSMAALRALLSNDPDSPEDGRFAIVLESPGGYLDYREARDYITSYLKQSANPTVNIAFKSTSRQITGEVEAGQSVVFNLPQFGIDTVLQVKQLTITDLGGIDPDGYPVLAYDFRFEAKLYDLASRFRKQQEQTGYAGRDAVAFIEKVLSASEHIKPTESAGILVSIGNGSDEVIPQEVTNLNTNIGTPPFYWAPTTGGRSPGKWSRSWFS